MASIAVFIDGANLHATTKALSFDMDFKKLLKYFQADEDTPLLRIYYYTSIDDSGEYSSIKPLIDWLDYNGFTVVKKATKEYINKEGEKKTKSNTDVELAVDAMEIIGEGKVDEVVLISGDGDFTALVKALQRKSVYVSAISTITTQPPMIADELRRAVDEFIDLESIKHLMTREVREHRHGHVPSFVKRDTDTE